MIWLLILLQEILCTTVFAADGNSHFSRSAYFITQENKRQAGHVVERVQSPSLMSFSHSCLRNSWCTSTNFKKSVKENENGTFELNKHETAPINRNTKLIDQPGVTFSTFLKVGTLLPIYAIGIQRQNERNSTIQWKHRHSDVLLSVFNSWSDFPWVDRSSKLGLYIVLFFWEETFLLIVSFHPGTHL